MRGLWVLILLAGCIPDEASLEGRACPCLEGFECVEDVCVPSGDTLRDSGVDAPEDEGVDRGRDEGMDDGVDLGLADMGDARIDAAEDGGADTGVDMGVDMGPGPTFCERLAMAALPFGCLDFDTEPSARDGWREDASAGGRLVFDETRAVEGRSLRATVGMGGFAEYANNRLASLSEGDFWMRVSVYVESGDAAEMDFYPLFTANATDSPPFPFLNMALIGEERLFSSVTLFEMGSTEDSSSLRFPTDQWFCVNVGVEIDRNGTVEVFVDSAPYIQLDPFDTRGDWNNVAVGASGVSPAQPEATVWYDNFVWSREQIPCTIGGRPD